MRPLKTLAVNVRKAKAEWRKALTDGRKTTEERRKARQAWKKVLAEQDRVLMLLLKTRSNRRAVGDDRRKASDPEWLKPSADRRKSERTRGRRGA